MGDIFIKVLLIRMKDYEKQEKRIKELKMSGTSKKKAETKQKEALTRQSFILRVCGFGSVIF